jgi:hypothetical protein
MKPTTAPAAMSGIFDGVVKDKTTGLKRKTKRTTRKKLKSSKEERRVSS